MLEDLLLAAGFWAVVLRREETRFISTAAVGRIQALTPPLTLQPVKFVERETRQKKSP